MRAELAAAHELGEMLLRRADNDPADRELRVQEHYGHGATLFHMGALAAAGEHLEAALAGCDPATHRHNATVYGGYNPGVACSLWLAGTLALQGRLEEAAARNREGLELSRRLPDAFSLAWACHAAAVSQQILGDWAASEALSAEAVRLAEEQGFPHVSGMASVNRGWALVMQGNTDDGIPLLRAGVEAVEATGAALLRPSYLGMLAAADAIEGERESAGRRFDEALAEVERTGERLYQPALLIGKSHFLVTGGARGRSAGAVSEAAEDCLRHALGVAREQGARLQQLRAAVALARHCRKRGRAAEGRVVLTAAHAWFANLPAAVPEIAAARRLLTELEA